MAFGAGTVVMTADGALPVEYLCPGDRVVTRSGLRRLAEVRVTVGLADIVRIAPLALGHGRPADTVVLSAATPVLVRDWRAQALFCTARAMVPAGRLADGRLIVRDRAEARLFAVMLDTPAVMQVAGIEVGCAAVTVPA